MWHKKKKNFVTGSETQIEASCSREQTLPQSLEHSVSISSFNVDRTISYFKIWSNEFKPGRLKHYIEQCRKITVDKEVLEIISRMKVNFENEPSEK